MTTAPTTARPYDLVDFLALEFPQVPSLVGNKVVIPGGLTVLGAQPKLGKSNLAQQLALARAYQQDWLGFPTTPGRTLYINAEIVACEFQGRFQQMVADRVGLPRGRVSVESVLGMDPYLNTPPGAALVETFIKVARPDLLILDPQSHLMLGNESDPAIMQAFLRVLARWRITYGLAIFLIHHLRKPPSDPIRLPLYRPSAHDLSGSSLLYRAADAVIIGHGVSGGPIELRFDLRHASAPDPFTITRGPDLWWTPTDDRAIPQLLRPALAILLDGPLAHTRWTEAIMAASSCSNATARRRIAEATEQGFATKGEDGGYRLTLATERTLKDA